MDKKKKYELEDKVRIGQEYLQRLNKLQVHLNKGRRISISVRNSDDPFTITDISGDSVLPWLREEKSRIEAKLKQLEKEYEEL